MGAGSAVTNLALAVAWTHQKGHPVLVAGTTEPDRATAVVVTPRPAPDALTPPRTGSAPAASATPTCPGGACART